MSDLITTPFGPKATANQILSSVDLSGKRMLVTGGAAGIGRETTAALARAGAQVTVAVRDPASAEGLLRYAHEERWPEPIRIERLDLADLRTVRRLISNWTGPLHAIVANAGIMAVPNLAYSREGWEMQLATNYLGHFALITGLLPALRASHGARVVVVSSGAHRLHPMDFDDPQFRRTPYDRWAAYGRSKTADVLMAVSFADRWADDGICSNALMPGWIVTGLQRYLDVPTLQSLGAVDEDGNAIQQPHFKTLEQGAGTSVLAAASPLLRGVTGRYFEDNQEAPITLDGLGEGVAAHAIDRDNAKRLWSLGESALS